MTCTVHVHVSLYDTLIIVCISFIASVTADEYIVSFSAKSSRIPFTAGDIFEELFTNNKSAMRGAMSGKSLRTQNNSNIFERARERERGREAERERERIN